MFERLPGRRLGALLFALAASPAMAGAVSHVQTLDLAYAPHAADEQVKRNQPYRANAASNGLSAVALDEASSSWAPG